MTTDPATDTPDERSTPEPDVTASAQPDAPQVPVHIDAAAHNRARLRWPKRVVQIGLVLAFVLSFLGTAGSDGEAGAALFFLLLALVFGVAAVVATGQQLFDEIKRQPTSRSRGFVAALLFIATFMAVMAHFGVSQSMASA